MALSIKTIWFMRSDGAIQKYATFMVFLKEPHIDKEPRNAKLTYGSYNSCLILALLEGLIL